jgi:3-methyl-2-oxobutanoate hydroxymethyltransferase
MKAAVTSFIRKKKNASRITMLTAYDFPCAMIADECGVDVVLVGDSVGTNVLGYPDIRKVTMEDMRHHVAAVARGVKHAFIIGDMPYRSFLKPSLAIKNAKTLIKAGAHGVKVEGGSEMADTVRFMIKNGILVCGHIGFMPQSGKKPGVVGKTLDQAQRLIESALCLEKAGAFMIVLELIPSRLAGVITKLLHIPTIGIGAGPYCDGQVQVLHDILGLSDRIFRHAKAFGQARKDFAKSISRYILEVKRGSFPADSNAADLADEVFEQVQQLLRKRA